MNTSKKTISPVVALTLLIVVSVTSVVYFQGWYNSYQSKLFSDLENYDSSLVNIEYLEPSQLYVKNANLNNISFSNIKIGNISCNINGTLSSNNISVISLGSCLSGESIGYKDVVVFTNKGIFSSKKLLASTLSSSGNLSYSFSVGSCPALYTRVYGLESISDSHAESVSGANYTYNLCLKHSTYTLGTSCSGIYARLFYLDQISDAHTYTINTTSYFNYTTWQQVCVSSSGGTIMSQINSTDPQDGSICAGSMETIDNINGVHMGDCSGYATKIWLKVQ